MPHLVHHYYPLGSANTGDALVARAIAQTLRQYLGDDIEIVPMPVNDRCTNGEVGLRGANLERTNAEADLVVIGGSNLLEPRRRGGWGVFTDVDAIATLRPPLLLLGMGTGSDFARRVRPYDGPARAQVRALHERAILAAVRDTLTVDKLARIGVNATCAGCPVTFLTDRAVTATEASDGPLIVSMPPTRLLRRWLGRRYVRSVMRYVTWLRDRDDTDVLVTLHDARDVDPARSLVPDGVPTFYSDDLDALIDRVERSRGVVGFRLHAALLGLALGKPVVPVALDWRGEAFIRTTALDACGVRALRTGQAAKLRTLTDRLLSSDPALLTQLIDAKTALAARYDAALTDGVTALRALGNGW